MESITYWFGSYVNLWTTLFMLAYTNIKLLFNMFFYKTQINVSVWDKLLIILILVNFECSPKHTNLLVETVKKERIFQ